MKKQKRHHEHGQGGRWLVLVGGEPIRDENGRLLTFGEKWKAESQARCYRPQGVVKAG